ncbi:MAG: glutathione S-transferase C-terminal domain-containing protein, partial [Pseudomonadota bacterium]
RPLSQGRGVKARSCRGRLERDVQRVGALWAGCRETFGADGPFLFGRFTVADAMFAPVVSRFKTYGPVDIPDTAQVYADALWALPAFAEWRRGAQREMAA